MKARKNLCQLTEACINSGLIREVFHFFKGCKQRVRRQFDGQEMNGFHRAQRVGDDFIELRAVVNIDVQLRKRSG